MIITLSCKKFVEVDTPIDRLTSEDVFQDEETASAAVLGIYTSMMTTNPVLTSGGVTLYAGLASDELYNSDITNTDLSEFSTNAISPDNASLSTDFWLKGYNLIYHANSCIEGLKNNTNLDKEVCDQLLGEALFDRAFVYYYLVSLFGEVPLLLTTDYQQNAVESRTKTSIVHEQIITDLKEAKNLLNASYPTDGRVRPNKWTATALLARIYLELDDWELAAQESSLIIDSGDYSLETDLNNVFLSSSHEAIWQIMPVEEGFNTTEGLIFIPYSWSSAPPDIPLASHLLNAFETNDLRKINWTGSTVIDGNIYYYPYKYKINEYGLQVTEYYMIFRLAEQYLIRAECYAHLNNIPEAKQDLNIIRERAGLSDIIDENAEELLTVIMHERRIELFSEWGHRWFDLKRTGKASEILAPLKPGWQATDTLFPIPLAQIRANSNLTQNEGY